MREGRTPQAPVNTGSVQRARDLLGVAADADGPALTRAYRQQARQLHPDLSPDPRAAEQFRALHAAYHLARRAARPAPAAPLSPPAQGSDGHVDRPTAPRPATSAGSEWVTIAGATTRQVGTWDDGIWLIAGPVHVQPADGVDSTKNPQEGRS
jgi:hypothetical protein